MRLLKKLFFTETKKDDKKTTTTPSTFDDGLSDLNVDTAEDLLAETPEPPLAESPDMPSEEDDLDFLDEVDFPESDALPAGGEIDIGEILRSAGIDVDVERESGQHTMEKTWELLDKGVPEESLPAIIEVAGQSVDDVVQNALQKGAACDKFESDFRQRHQELIKGLTEEMSSVELETDEEIQKFKAEMEARIKELDEQRVAKLEELRQGKQQATADYDKTIEILDAYEEKCTTVAKALKRVTHKEDVAAPSEAATE